MKQKNNLSGIPSATASSTTANRVIAVHPPPQGTSANLSLPGPPAARSCQSGQDSWLPPFLHLFAFEKDKTPADLAGRG